MASHDKLWTETFDSERVGPSVGGLEPAPHAVLSGITCLPLYPVDMNIKVSMGVHPSINLQAIMTHGILDILQGDILIIDSGRYDVRFVNTLDHRPNRFYYKVMLEERIDQ